MAKHYAKMLIKIDFERVPVFELETWKSPFENAVIRVDEEDFILITCILYYSILTNDVIEFELVAVVHDRYRSLVFES